MLGPLFLLLIAACSDQEPSAVAPDELALDRGDRADRSVSPSGRDTGECRASPCLTIGYAVSRAAADDRISVAAGIYHETVIVTKRLVLAGHDAIIDAAGQTSPANGLVISGPQAAGTVITGFTVKNAGLEGIFVNRTSHVTIADNTVIDNDAYGPLSPLCVDQPDDCGEAVHLQTVSHSIVRGNLVRDNVGGILLTDEDGPTFDNRISDNRVLDNTEDCGITLASHYLNPASAVTPDQGGVYRNTVIDNVAAGNGAAGIGVFAGPPGAAAWGNRILHNRAEHNGGSGIMIHSHTPAQTADRNVITGNEVGGNGPDVDNPFADQPTGISIFSAVVPIPHTVVAANRIRDEHFGILSANAVKLEGLPSNRFAEVAVPISNH